MTKPTYEIDGAAFWTLEEFFAEIGRKLIPGAEWGHNLDAFNDILRGGFGTPEGGFILHWRNAQLSRERLGHAEAVRHLRKALRRNWWRGREELKRALRCAQNGTGPTVFDWIVEIIRTHCPEGEEAEDGVELVLD